MANDIYLIKNRTMQTHTDWNYGVGRQCQTNNILRVASFNRFITMITSLVIQAQVSLWIFKLAENLYSSYCEGKKMFLDKSLFSLKNQI
jgi:hypothetical protein